MAETTNNEQAAQATTAERLKNIEIMLQEISKAVFEQVKHERVEARALVLVDSQGKERLLISGGDYGQGPRIDVYDTEVTLEGLSWN